MELTLKSEVLTRELTASFEVDANNIFNIVYRYSTRDGVLDGNVDAHATKQGAEQGMEGLRQVINMNTRDGVQFNGGSWELVGDNLTGLSGKIKADLITIVADPETYLEAV